MTKIFKYELKPSATQKVSLPIGSKILDIQKQGDVICLWAEVDASEAFRVDLGITIVGTGDSIPFVTSDHFKTVQHGDCVWHFYLNRSLFAMRTLFK